MNFEYNLNTSKCIPILLEIWRTGTVTNCATINQLGCNTRCNDGKYNVSTAWCFLSNCLCWTDENNNLKIELCRSQYCGWYLSVFTAFGLADLQQDGFPVGETCDMFKGLYYQILSPKNCLTYHLICPLKLPDASSDMSADVSTDMFISFLGALCN